MSGSYPFLEIEPKWQARWESEKRFRAEVNPSKSKFYALDMFPYPSGAGLHAGHPEGYTATDIVSHYKRLNGFSVMHPMGFDAFGLPAEQYAIEHGVHPRDTTEKNIANMLRQLKRLGFSYDWDRCLATTDIAYVRWTQWIFLQLFNSYFDREAGKARPVSELLERLETGRLLVGQGGELVSAGSSAARETARSWQKLSAAERSEVLSAHRLAYMAEVPVNWCPALGTVLANEEVTNEGLSERGNHPVFKRPLRQWMLRITAYAERLADDLEPLDWPESIKIMQRNWIGRSEGALVEFRIDGTDAALPVFTTRPDTLFGATYMVLAPEHPLVERIATSDCAQAVKAYREQAGRKSDLQRTDLAKEKTGVFTGAYAVNPVNGECIPIWIADYVLMGYGTGAIMAVPAHDQRDFEFARQFGLPIRAVVMPDDAWLSSKGAVAEAYVRNPGALNEAFTGLGVSVNSANQGVSLNGRSTDEAQQVMSDWLERTGVGRRQVQYKLRDWLFSRQRYWGEPIPVLHAPDGTIVALDESELPLTLPDMDDFRPVASGAGDSSPHDAPPKPPLGRAPESWRVVKRDGVRYERELNTMPQWAGSCWYYLRYLDPKNESAPWSKDAERYWMPVDLYVGGAEHAVLHLLYSRFWHKALYDLGHVSSPEPFMKLVNQGMILGEDGEKMSKSRGNVINPDEIVERHGADAFRLYEMFMGPLEAVKPWSTKGMAGIDRFLNRVWDLGTLCAGLGDGIDGAPGESDESAWAEDLDLRRQLHATIRKVTEDIESMRFNTAISALMVLSNHLQDRCAVSANGQVSAATLSPGRQRVMAAVMRTFLVLLAPFAPHIAEELWERLGHRDSIFTQSWPAHDPAALASETITLIVQINGKLRSRIKVPSGADQRELKDAALADAEVKRWIDGKTVRNVVVVPNRLVNIVV